MGLTNRTCIVTAFLAAAGAVAALPATTMAATDGDSADRGVGIGTSFTYQGRLIRSGVPQSGPFDFQFRTYTSALGGIQVGPTLTISNVAVSEGLFTVDLDFGNVFTGAPRYLSMAVRPAGIGGYTGLSPRQSIDPTPYAMYAEHGGTVRDLQDAYDGGQSVVTDLGNLVIEGPAAAQFGTSDNPSANVNFYFPSTPFESVTLREHFGGERGGAMTFRRGGSGSAYALVEPEGSTDGLYGGWFFLENNNGGNGVRYDADIDGLGNSNLLISDDGGSVVIDLNDTVNDNKVVVPGSSISALETLNEAGVAHNHGNANGPALATAVTNIGSRTITTTGAGYVIAIGTAEVFCDSDASYFQLGVSSTSSSYEDGLEFLHELPGGVAFDTSGTVQSVFNVSSAGSHTFYFVGNGSPADACDVSDWSLTLIYVPTGYGTVAATGPEFPHLHDKDAKQLMGSSFGVTPEQINAEIAEAKAQERSRMLHELQVIQARIDEIMDEISDDTGNSN